MKKLLLISFILFAVKAFAAIDGAKVQEGNLFPQVKMTTNQGVIIVELNRLRAPLTVNNFLSYVSDKSYENTVFHRVIEDFVVQGGGYSNGYDALPTNKPVFNESGNGLKNDTGTIALARQRDPHSGTRQFYFNLSDNRNLDPGRNWGYCVFGEVVEGQDVLKKMGVVETDVHPKLGWPDVPVEPLILKKVEVMPVKPRAK